jgi:hypothetical protein
MSLYRMALERRPHYHAKAVVGALEWARAAFETLREDSGTLIWIQDFAKVRIEMIDAMLPSARRNLRFEEDRLGVKRDPSTSEAQAIRLSAEDKKKIAEATPAPSASAPSDVQHRWRRLQPGLAESPGYCACGWPKWKWDNRPAELVPYKQWKAHARAAAKRGEIVDYGGET